MIKINRACQRGGNALYVLYIHAVLGIGKLVIPTEDFRDFTQFLQAIKTATK